MAGAVDEKGSLAAKTKSSLGFGLPFADHAPANPIEVFAVATAASIALTTQFANAVFGMMQAAMPASRASVSFADAEPPSDEDKPSTVNTAHVSDDSGVVRSQAVLEAASAKPSTEQAGTTKVSRRKTVRVEQAAIKPVQLTTEHTEVPAKPLDAAMGRRSAVSRKKKRSDDLKKISGIGPKLEELLIGMGVLRFEDIAGWTEKEIEHFDRELGLDGRIAKDDWIAQAKALLR